MNSRTLSHRLIALCLALALSQLFAARVDGATADAGKSKFFGELTVSGITKVNGEAAISGQTIFSGSTIETTPESTSFVSLGARGRLQLLKSSRLTLSFDESSINCSLETGTTRVSVPMGVGANVTTKEGTIISDRAQDAVFSVESQDGSLLVAVLRGHVEIRSKDGARQIGSGQFAFIEDDVQSPPTAKKGSSKGERAALFVLIGLGVLLTAVVFSGGNSTDEDSSFGGCVQTLSPVDGGSTCS